MANLPLHWGKSSHTHTVSVSHVPDNQSGLPVVRKHGGKQPIILINNHHWQEKWGEFKGSFSPKFAEIAAGSGLYKLSRKVCLIR